MFFVFLRPVTINAMCHIENSNVGQDGMDVFLSLPLSPCVRFALFIASCGVDHLCR